MADWRNLNKVRLSRLKDTTHLRKQIRAGKMRNLPIHVDVKKDGTRCTLQVDVPDKEGESARIHLISRGKEKAIKGSEASKNSPYCRMAPEDWMAVLRLPGEGGSCVLDGERIAVGVAEAASNAMRKDVPKAFMAFDILMLNGEDLRLMPMCDRRTVMESVVADLRGSLKAAGLNEDSIIPLPFISYDHLTEAKLDSLLESAKTAGLEGFVVKPIERTYGPNNYGWKVKPEDTVDAIVTGWQEAKRSKLGKFTRTGQVGTVQVAVWTSTHSGPRTNDYAKAIEEGELKVVAFVPIPGDDRVDLADARDHLWGRVVEFSYYGFDGKRCRHPSFERWRDGDKPVDDCVIPEYW